VATIREIGSHTPANFAKNSFLDLKPFGTAILSITRTTNLLAFQFSFFPDACADRQLTVLTHPILHPMKENTYAG
jgi:hypothetical protein